MQNACTHRLTLRKDEEASLPSADTELLCMFRHVCCMFRCVLYASG